MARKRKDRSKDIHPPKGQPTLMKFQGFHRSVQSQSNEPPEKEKAPQFCCEYCGLSHLHDGARKMHQRFCNRKPAEIPFTVTSFEMPLKQEDVQSFLDEILLNICKNSTPGGWRHADIFSKSKKKEMTAEAIENIYFASSNTTSIDQIDSEQKVSNNEAENLDSIDTLEENIRPPLKKTRKSYNFVQKAEILAKFASEQDKDPLLSLSVFAEQADISKSMLSKWLADKNDIFQKSAELKIQHLKKGRESKKHNKTFVKLNSEFLSARDRGRKVSFTWLWVKGRKIARDINEPPFTKKAVERFLKKYQVKIRRVQRKKAENEDDIEEKLRNWHVKYRETCIKSHQSDPNYDKKWGRFKPYQRFNVDQVPLPFVLDNKQTYERPLGKKFI